MNVFDNQCLEILKSETLTTAGFDHVTPADCKVISLLVTNKTRQTISETTLKRIYGFAFSKFKPSLFTIDTLAKFSGYAGWTDFCQKKDQANKNIPEQDIDWVTLRNNVNKITNFTLQALKNKSGIPYNQTIKRKFVNDHIDAFLTSDDNVTLFSGPSGYGKTIGLCHWVDQKMEQSLAGKDQDIVLFFSSNALMSVLLSGRDINDWMLALLGYSADNDVNVLLDIRQRKSGNFYLVIDGFDEHMFKNEQFRILLNHIVDIFSFYKSHDWFKLVLTMRSYTWVNNRHEIENEAAKWYTGFLPGDFCINVPLFNIAEIKELCRKINPSIQNFIALDVAEHFNHPLYFQFYYTQHKNDFTFNNVDHLSIYELVSTFIHNKVYVGQHSTEKILLIEKLVAQMDIINDNYKVEKLKINELIKQYNHAYLELTGLGIIRELNESTDYSFVTHIEFVDNNFLDHSIAKTLLYNNNDKFDSVLIEKINKLFANDGHKVSVMKWCVIYAIRTGQLDGFERLTEVQLGSNEKVQLIKFLGDLLDKESSSPTKNEALMSYFKQDFSEKMFDYFFGLELVNTSYKKTLKTLLKFELTDSQKILIYTTLGVIAIIKAELNELKECILKLKSFGKHNYQHFVVNPLDCLETLYHYLKYGTIKPELLHDLTKLSFNPPTDSARLKHTSSNDLLFLLAVYTLRLSNNPKKSLRFINFLSKIYRDHLVEDKTNQYRFFIKIAKADAYFKLGDTEAVLGIYRLISSTYRKRDNLLTPYMKTLFYSLKIKALLNTSRENSIPDEIKILFEIAGESGDKISKLVVSTMILNESLSNMFPEFYRQVKHSFYKTLNETGLHPDAFTNNMALKE